MKDIKTEDVFGDQVSASDLAMFAASAINNHDRLVEENEKLKEAATEFMADLEMAHSISLKNNIGAGTRRSLTKLQSLTNKGE